MGRSQTRRQARCASTHARGLVEHGDGPAPHSQAVRDSRAGQTRTDHQRVRIQHRSQALLIGALATAIIIWYGGGEILKGLLTFGALVALALLSGVERQDAQKGLVTATVVTGAAFTGAAEAMATLGHVLSIQV